MCNVHIYACCRITAPKTTSILFAQHSRKWKWLISNDNWQTTWTVSVCSGFSLCVFGVLSYSFRFWFDRHRCAVTVTPHKKTNTQNEELHTHFFGRFVSNCAICLLDLWRRATQILTAYANVNWYRFGLRSRHILDALCGESSPISEYVDSCWVIFCADGVWTGEESIATAFCNEWFQSSSWEEKK